MKLINVGRLINDRLIEVEEFVESSAKPYGILSHVWEGSEILFQNIGLPGTESNRGYSKIERACQLAARKGLNYIWIDTCCIDKSSSSELSEAINSMFRWYMNSDICFVYLFDLDEGVTTQSGLEQCKWFTRGWTLQELIAPSNVEFYDAAWNMRGTKQGLEEILHQITGIDKNVLRNSDSISNIPVARKMSWAASRQTTRNEDLAYCLLGIFDVNMPLLYGEGYKSFLRLQEEIIKATPDLTIFGWKSPNPEEQEYRGILARSPHEFASPPEQRSNNIPPRLLETLHGEFSVTNKGVRIASRLLCVPSNPDMYLLPLRYDSFNCGAANSQIGIYLRKFGANSFVRALPGSIHSLDPKIPYDIVKERVIYVTKEIAANMCDSINSILCSAIQFRLPKNVLIKQVYPESLWDSQCNLFLVPEPDSFWGTVHIFTLEQTEVEIDVPIWADRDVTSILCFFVAQKPIGLVYSCDGKRDWGRYNMENARNLNFEKFYNLIKEGSSVLELNKHVRINFGIALELELRESMDKTAPRFCIDIRTDSSSNPCNIM
jgi:hypothetical protein